MQSSRGFYLDRAPRRYRDHRGLDRSALAGSASRARGGAAKPVHEQPEANGPGDAQLPPGQRLFPPRRVPHLSEQRLQQLQLERPRPDAALHGATASGQRPQLHGRRDQRRYLSRCVQEFDRDNNAGQLVPLPVRYLAFLASGQRGRTHVEFYCAREQLLRQPGIDARIRGSAVGRTTERRGLLRRSGRRGHGHPRHPRRHRQHDRIRRVEDGRRQSEPGLDSQRHRVLVGALSRVGRRPEQ